jgi:hypothetical protein
MSILIIFLLAWNFGISWLNCWYVGKVWAESKVIGGWMQFVTICAAIMGACGFIWCNLLVIGYLASTHVGLLPLKYQLTDTYLELLWNIGYVLIIFPILGSGMGIWADSVKQAYKRRDGMSIGVAGYNTFAQVYNTYEAAKFLPSIFKAIGKTLDSTKSGQGKLMLLTVYTCLTLSIGGGLGLAYYIIHSTAVSVAQDEAVKSTLAQVASRG